jgi:hypothetical protein
MAHPRHQLRFGCRHLSKTRCSELKFPQFGIPRRVTGIDVSDSVGREEWRGAGAN